MEELYNEKWNYPYVFDMFEGYDYRNPEEAWKIHCGDKEGIRNSTWQMKAFHYWWIVEQCRKTGEIGLAIDVYAHPFCFNVHSKRGSGHIWSHLNSIHKVLEPGFFPLIIASAAIPAIECEASPGVKCSGLEITKYIQQWSILLKSNGVLIAAILDNAGPLTEGRSLVEHDTYKHAWTAKQFERNILPVIRGDETFEVEEFDSLKSGMGFNLVLRKIGRE